jgi:GT2 family glycosyltransferase
LLIDLGEGFVLRSSIAVPPSPSGSGRRGIDFIIEAEAARLRLDSSSEGGNVHPAAFRLRRLTGAEYLARSAGSAVTHFRMVGHSAPWIAKRALTKLGDLGPAGFVRKLRDIGNSAASRAQDYERWIALHETPEADSALAEAIKGLETPLFSILMPVYETPKEFLRAAIESVLAQSYRHWQLCIVDDASQSTHVQDILKEYAAGDSRVQFKILPENRGISGATNEAFALSRGTWVVLLDHDDLLSRNALAELALAIRHNPSVDILYSDEDKIGAGGYRFDPHFKSAFAPELLHSQNYLNHLTACRSASVARVGGWRKKFDGSQDYDLILRLIEQPGCTVKHIPKVLYHWRATEGSTALTESEKSYAFDAGLEALRDHLSRCGVSAEAMAAPETNFYRVRYRCPEPTPLVSIVIPSRDQVELLQACIGSVQSLTTYRNVEILVVDNNSTQRAAIRYLDELQKTPGIRVLQYKEPFNFAAINNFAVRHAKGQILALLNNDLEVISPDWLTEMVSFAVRPEIGCVGAKLYYRDGSIQHAGVVLGIGGVAGHAHKYFPRQHPGSFFRLKIVQNFSAVTGACLVVKKELYESVSGMDEINLPVAFNDVDLCLKIGKLGFRHVWTPYAELYHHESVSRGSEDTQEKRARFLAEVEYMRRTWNLANDPYYSPNLTLHREDFSIGYDRVSAVAR